ncbi:MAG: carboxypeptidase-like regulatory domain-containing protein [Bryobacterales bacterium]|nr:carboxypeptidase-like regulatory domain-containing protein [Bryobacterales bacterium]
MRVYRIAGTPLLRMLVLMLAASAGLPAQSTLGTIRGVATDLTGAVAPDTEISVRNIDTNIIRRTTTGSTGDYEVTQLIPGRYEVIAEKPGFKKMIVTNIRLETSTTFRADVRMEVGEVATSVNVEATAPVINTEGAEVAAVRSNEVMEKLPFNVRGQFDGFYFSLAVLTPGATQAQGSNFSFSGTRGSQYGTTVDGTSQRSPLFGNSVGPSQSNMEMTGEIRIQLANDKAEAGLPGGMYATSRSGTNQLHGSLFWYHSNSRLVARNTFSTSVPFSVQNNYGGSLGGPIRKDRTFFFATYERFPLRNETIFNSSVPSVAFRGGDFSSLLPGTVVSDPLSGNPFPNNRIPADRLSQPSVKIQDQFYPLPNSGPATSYQQNWKGNLPGSQYKTQVEGRVDHQLSSSNSLFGRFSWNRTGANVWDYSLPTIPKRDQDRRSTTVTLSDTHLFSPVLVNEFRFGTAQTANPSFNPLDGPGKHSACRISGTRSSQRCRFSASITRGNRATDISDPSDLRTANNIT